MLRLVPPPDAHWEGILVSNKKYVQICMASRSTWRQTTAVVSGVQLSESVVNSRRSLHLQRPWYDVKVEREPGSIFVSWRYS